MPTEQLTLGPSLSSLSHQYQEITGKDLKAKIQGPFYKVINLLKNHHGYTYQLGINRDHLSFSPYRSCCPGGLYFTSLPDLFDFASYGSLVATIEIPDDARIYLEGNKAKADYFIILELTPLNEFVNRSLAIGERAVLVDPDRFLRCLTYVSPWIRRLIVNGRPYLAGHLKNLTDAELRQAIKGCPEIILELPKDLLTPTHYNLAVREEPTLAYDIPRKHRRKWMFSCLGH